jgi:predicted lysophospholipase L1 biosynthesis ABC-type transport system permease subunit
MIIIVGAILGAGIGGVIAWRRKGRLPDILLYAVVYGLLFALGTLFATLILHRTMA